MERTHSRLTWGEFIEEALGEVGLHPWEFCDYSLADYISKRNGFFKNEKRKFGELITASVFPWMNKGEKNKIIKSLQPKVDPVKAKNEYNKILERYKKAGAINAGKRDQNNNRG